MNYTSVLYYAFLAALILLYYIVPDRAKWPVLLAGSLVFYRLLVGNTLMFAAFLLMIAASYGFGLLIERSSAKRSPAAEGSPVSKGAHVAKGSPASKGLLAAGILVTAAPLIAFKVSESGSAHFANVAAHVPAPFSSGKSLLLPIGASFFTLQMIAYLVDIYRGKISAQRNPLRYALFISFFPQIIQGPIPRYEQLGEQLFTPHKFDSRNLVRGFHLILWGFFLKFMIADKAGVVVDTVFGNAKMYKGVYVLVAGALYSIQLYADFQSCTTLSRGAAKCLGIDVINNFDHPYLATSIKDFWRRWHISLSTWLRDYVYIPAGGSRRGTFRKYLNLVLTFAVSGIWHGGSFKFLFWGLLHAFYQITGDFTMKARDRVYELLRIDRDSYLRHIFKSAGTFFLAMTAWIIFRAGSLRTALQMILSMFTVRNYWVLWDDSLLTLGLDWKEWSVLLHSIALLFVISLLQTKGSVSAWILRQHIIVRWTVYIGAVLAVMLCGTYGFGYDAKAFIYGGF